MNAFPICPGFLQSLLHGHAKNGIHSIDRVRQELTDAFGQIMLWAQRHPRYADAAKAMFASGADGWLVAYGRVHQRIVVTNEERAPDSQKNKKLPDVCDAFGVETEDTFKMLERIGVQFQSTA